MKMRKLFAIVLSLIMVMTLLAGCSKGSSNTKEDESSVSSNEEPTTGTNTADAQIDTKDEGKLDFLCL